MLVCFWLHCFTWQLLKNICEVLMQSYWLGVCSNIYLALFVTVSVIEQLQFQWLLACTFTTACSTGRVWSSAEMEGEGSRTCQNFHSFQSYWLQIQVQTLVLSPGAVPRTDPWSCWGKKKKKKGGEVSGVHFNQTTAPRKWMWWVRFVKTSCS